MRLRVFSLLLGLVLLSAGSAVQAQSLTITHDPVPFALRGQPLTLKAKVHGAAKPESVTLYYALFRDAAPFRVAMKSSGLDYYVGSIEANVLGGVDSVSYYIEAQDDSGAITETPWYEVKFREPRPSERPVAVAVPPAPAPAGPAPVIPVSTNGDGGEKANWKTPALIAGGAVVLLGGAYAISQSGGGGGGDDNSSDESDNSGDDTSTAAGTYIGIVTTCTDDGAATACESHSFSLLIDVHNSVYSDTLSQGHTMADTLNNNHFTLTATINEGGATGTRTYTGTRVGNSVIGQITGTATTPTNTQTYTGSFSANK